MRSRRKVEQGAAAAAAAAAAGTGTGGLGERTASGARAAQRLPRGRGTG